VDENGNRSDVTVDASGVHAWGYNLGLTAKLDEQVTFGVNYRSRIDMKAKNGDATFSDMRDFLQSTYQDVKFNATMPVPAELTFVFSFQISDKWLASVDVILTCWDAYDTLVTDSDYPVIVTSCNPVTYIHLCTYGVL